MKCSVAPRLDQIDRRAAEAAAGHSRAEDALHVLGEIDHEIGLGAAHLVIVAQTRMRGVHEPPEKFEIARFERRRRSKRARVFRHHVTRAAQDRPPASPAP